eukprot:5895480-Amphidinium_carterae.3
MHGNTRLWCANVNSLRTHWEVVSEPAADILCVVETHLEEHMLKSHVGKAKALGLKSFYSAAQPRVGGVGIVTSLTTSSAPRLRNLLSLA